MITFKIFSPCKTKNTQYISERSGVYLHICSFIKQLLSCRLSLLILLPWYGHLSGIQLLVSCLFLFCEMSSVLFSQFLTGEMYFFSAHYQFLIVSESMGGSILCSKSQAVQHPTQHSHRLWQRVSWFGGALQRSKYFWWTVFLLRSMLLFLWIMLSIPAWQHIVFREKNPTALYCITRFFCSFLCWNDFHFTLLLQIRTSCKIRKKLEWNKVNISMHQEFLGTFLHIFSFLQFRMKMN